MSEKRPNNGCTGDEKRSKTCDLQLSLSLMDLTSLGDKDTDAVIEGLASSAFTPYGTPAALCVYSQFVGVAKNALKQAEGGDKVKVATVVNFPEGGSDVPPVVEHTKDAVAKGADEVDLVFPYRALLAGDIQVCKSMVEEVSKVCKEAGVQLKVILESGCIMQEEKLREASQISIQGGADFLKTSTGKVPINATPFACKVMLEEIKKAHANGSKLVGFKGSGGIRTGADASTYLSLGREVIGQEYLVPATFRFGASGLLGNLVKELSGSKADTNTSNY